MLIHDVKREPTFDNWGNIIHSIRKMPLPVQISDTICVVNARRISWKVFPSREHTLGRGFPPAGVKLTVDLEGSADGEDDGTSSSTRSRSC